MGRMDIRAIKEQLKNIEEELKKEVIRLCGEAGIKDKTLRDFEYKTISLCMLEIRTEGGRVYRYQQLKGELERGKTITINNWRHEETPFRTLNRLINLYRAVKGVMKANEYLKREPC
ncbi:MAG: hypothetical protein JHC21_00565 [Thermocrinis sp.]|nr:hypothetical protein [Thermocrinis sp.]